MATGDKRTNIYSRRNLPLSMLSTYMYDNLRQQVLDLTRALYNSRGVFSGGTFSFGGVDSVSISAIEALDKEGYLIRLEAHSNTAFPNTTGHTYYLGSKYIEVEVPETPTNAIEVSPFLGTFNYRFYEENVGEIGYPDQVIDNGATITFVVDGVVGTMDNSGRSVKAWLTSPISGNSGWYEDLTVVYGTNPNWTGSKNYVTTTGDFYQRALTETVTTATSAYRIWMHGVTITETDISSDTNYIFLGTITGNGPHVIPITHDQSGMIILPSSISSYNIYLDQLAKDYYGDAYAFNGLNQRSSRGEGLFAVGATTPDISNYRVWDTVNVAVIPTAITNLDGGKVGDIRKIICHDKTDAPHTTLQAIPYSGTPLPPATPGLLLKDNTDWTITYGDNITLLCLDSTAANNVWIELGRTEHGGGFISTSTSSSSSSSSSSSTCTSSSSSSFSSSSSSTSVSSSTTTTSSTVPV